ncbi:ABC transporter permease [Lichenihabitans sp. Uapishka_5]|uniref:ABC transporter permease n=1 Tax=Lichenihabitans sp. Uapishka_5 TaxID=3037302 RepID=UPI0029E81C24|nr:ABC transporter permease [Lichenihabitans sp. Uapishka_5]MDX7951378.1 ABC transporter permease [Lichenihabitans sp. Uapishka_5]
MLFFSEMSPVFFTLDNLLAVVAQNAPTLIVTSVFALLLMAGYVDLSVGSMMALVGVISGITIINWGMTAGIFVGIAVGTGLGALNGALVGILRMSPIVVTLGGLAAERGMAQYLGQGSVYGFPDPFVDFGSGSIAGIPNLALIAGIICTVVAVTSECLPIGKRVIAIGVNPRAAYLVGVRVTAIVFGLYTLTGVAVGVAGLLLIARLNSAPSGTLGTGFEVTVLTAVLLGGVPFTGGRGSIWRVMVGVWLMSILRNGLILLNVGTEVSGIITGGVLVCAAVLEALRARLKLSA